jgi:hypothetical protein
MPIRTVNDLLADENTSVEKLLNALTWLTADITRLKNRQRWVEFNALPETVKSINAQISVEINEVEELISSIKLRIESKCTN